MAVGFAFFASVAAVLGAVLAFPFGFWPGIAAALFSGFGAPLILIAISVLKSNANASLQPPDLITVREVKS